MTQLEDLLDIQYLDIKSIQEVAKESSQPGRYKKYFEFERSLIQRGIAPSLSAYLLYEYQFNKKTLEDLGRELGLSWRPVKELMQKMNIPIKTRSEAHMEVYPSKETRMKISKAHKGITPSEETRRKMSEAHKGENHPLYGKHPSKETRRKISDALKGRTLSEETRKKMSEAHKGEKHPLYGKHPSKETRRKMSASQRGLVYDKHLEDLDYVVQKLQDVMDFYDLLNLPSERELYEFGYPDLAFAIKLFHGGFSRLRELLCEPEELVAEVA
jgi:hypothetical protein